MVPMERRNVWANIDLAKKCRSPTRSFRAETKFDCIRARIMQSSVLSAVLLQAVASTLAADSSTPSDTNAYSCEALSTEYSDWCCVEMHVYPASSTRLGSFAVYDYARKYESGEAEKRERKKPKPKPDADGRYDSPTKKKTRPSSQTTRCSTTWRRPCLRNCVIRWK